MTTAAQLVARRRITQAAARRHPRKLPPAKQPTGATLALTAPLLAIARDIDAAVNEALAAEGLDVLRTDAADGDLPPINRRGLLARLSRLAARIVQRRGSFLDDALVKVGDAVSAFSKSQWQAQAKAAMGVDLSVIEPNLAPAIKAFRQSHVDLITTMTQSKVERVRAILEDAGPGSRVETIRNRLMEDEGVSKRQASLIARDQVLKLNSAVTRKRHEAAGVTHYIWRTSGDASVRPEHRKLEGKKFAYDSPPVVSKKGDRARPGEFYQCRCTMEPFLEGFDEDLGDAPSQPEHNREAFAQGPLSRPAARRRKPAAVPARAPVADEPDEGPVTVRAAQWGKGGPPRGR